MDALGSVTHTFTWHDAPETVLHAVKHRSPNASAGRTTNNDACVNVDGPQVASQVGTKKCRRVLLDKHAVSSMRGHVVINFRKWVVLGPSAQQGNLLRENSTISGMLKAHFCVENRHAFGAS